MHRGARIVGFPFDGEYHFSSAGVFGRAHRIIAAVKCYAGILVYLLCLLICKVIIVLAELERISCHGDVHLCKKCLDSRQSYMSVSTVPVLSFHQFFRMGKVLDNPVVYSGYGSQRYLCV